MTDESMKLPAGMCCRVCALFPRCEKMFGCNPASQECDFYPVRFSVSPKRFLEECTESDRLRAEVNKLQSKIDNLSWRNVKNSLPDDNIEVLVWDLDIVIPACLEDGTWYDNFDRPITGIEWWMPYPVGAPLLTDKTVV